MRDAPAEPRVAILVPCYNEVATVAKVVADFRRVLPGATVYVYDNNSTDGTAAAAARAGAMVRRERRQGKGYVIASMLTEVDADLYIMVDGDDTYPADAAPKLLAPLLRGDADMVVGHRLAAFSAASFRPLHLWGNKLVRGIINLIFSARLRDIMSGYRAFTREVAEALPVVASGFDVETELTLQLLYRRFVLVEVPVPYGVRPAGSVSKLRTFHDGVRVIVKILGVFKAYKPMTFFGGLALLMWAAALVIGWFPIREYILYEYVFSVPKAVLAASCMLLGFILASMGVLLHTLNFRTLELTSVLVKQVSALRRSLR